MDAEGDVPQALGSVVDHVEGRDVGQEGLCCANVASGLLLLNLLLSLLQTQPVDC